MTRYFMSIPEAANLVIHAACLTKGDDIFILKMGEVVPIRELAERMVRVRGLRPYIDIPIQFTGMRPGEKMHEELYTASECPSETAHPQIIQLHTWDASFDPGTFLSDLTFTLGKRYADCAEALQELRDLTGQRTGKLPYEKPLIRMSVSSPEALRLAEQQLFRSFSKTLPV
jgi:FlaA1/EpsC-like NDP-sugar epimerase